MSGAVLADSAGGEDDADLSFEVGPPIVEEEALGRDVDHEVTAVVVGVDGVDEALAQRLRDDEEAAH